MNSVFLFDKLERYLALRRAFGFNMRPEERLLRDFAIFVEGCGLDGPITAQVAVDWACSTSKCCGPGGQSRRLSVARGFLQYLCAIDSDTQVPSSGLLPHMIRPTPYIYSDAEIEALITAAKQLGPKGSLRPYSYATLIGLLASTGLRAGEAIRLQINDMNLDDSPPLLKILHTKFRKSRLVPIHRSVANALREYSNQKQCLGYEGLCDTFFVSESGIPFKYRAVSWTFVSLARKIGIRGPVGEKGPSLHSLRHTFAVRRLLSWYREGVNVRERLPELSVYMGHVRPEGTYWYLTATPELFRLASDRFEDNTIFGGAP